MRWTLARRPVHAISGRRPVAGKFRQEDDDRAVERFSVFHIQHEPHAGKHELPHTGIRAVRRAGKRAISRNPGSTLESQSPTTLRLDHERAFPNKLAHYRNRDGPPLP
jgi:hypothetical protein